MVDSKNVSIKADEYLLIYIFSSNFIGFISMEEFEEACGVLNGFHDKNIIPSSSIRDLAKALDINKDGNIDFNEFLEAFRLVNSSIEEKSVTFEESDGEEA